MNKRQLLKICSIMNIKITKKITKLEIIKKLTNPLLHKYSFFFKRNQEEMDSIVFNGDPTFQLSEKDLTIYADDGGIYTFKNQQLLGKGTSCMVYKYTGNDENNKDVKYAIRKCIGLGVKSEDNISTTLNKLNYTAKQRLITTRHGMTHVTKYSCKNNEDCSRSLEGWDATCNKEGKCQIVATEYIYIMKYYDMDLMTYFNDKNNDHSLDTKLKILNKVRELVLGLANNGYYYMDLKPDNVLCNVNKFDKNTIDIDSIVLGDIGSFIYNNNELASTFPPPEASSNTGFINFDELLIKYRKERNENITKTEIAKQMLSYLMGIMIVFLCADSIDIFRWNNKKKWETPERLEFLDTTYSKYLNPDPWKRKKLKEQITEGDLPPQCYNRKIRTYRFGQKGKS